MLFSTFCTFNLNMIDTVSKVCSLYRYIAIGRQTLVGRQVVTSRQLDFGKQVERGRHRLVGRHFLIGRLGQVQMGRQRWLSINGKIEMIRKRWVGRDILVGGDRWEGMAWQWQVGSNTSQVEIGRKDKKQGFFHYLTLSICLFINLSI